MAKVRTMTKAEQKQHQDARVLAALFVLTEDESTTQRIADESGSADSGFVTEAQARASLNRLEAIGLAEMGKKVYDGPAKRRKHQTWKPTFFTTAFYKEIT